MSRAIEALRTEDEEMQFALEVLAKLERELGAGMRVEPDDIDAFLGFLDLFADRCHQGKKERLLLPALLRVCRSADTGPLAGMALEHRLLRARIADMRAALRPQLDRVAFVRAAGHYTRLLRRNLQQEREVLWPLAEAALTPAQMEALFEAFEAHQAEVLSAARREQLRDMLEALDCKYPA